MAWLVLFGNTLAARPDRPRLLASLLVVFGAAFVVKYVLLGAMYAPDGGVTRRVVLALVEGVSLGTLAYQPAGPATGYVAFVTVLLFLGGVAALPRETRRRGPGDWRSSCRASSSSPDDTPARRDRDDR